MIGDVRLIFIGIGLFEAARLALLQVADAEVVPNGLWEFAKDFPVLAIVLMIGYFMVKWVDRMLQSQQVNLKEVYGSHQAFLSSLLLNLEKRQNANEDASKETARNVAVLSAQVERFCETNEEIRRLLEVRSERRGL